MLKKVILTAALVLTVTPVLAKPVRSVALYREFHTYRQPNNTVIRKNGQWLYCTKGHGCITEERYAKGYLPDGSYGGFPPPTNARVREMRREKWN